MRADTPTVVNGNVRSDAQFHVSHIVHTTEHQSGVQGFSTDDGQNSTICGCFFKSRRAS